MKRSEINEIMRSAEAFIHQCGFFLPPFAFWTPSDWQEKGTEVMEIVENGLGWDITDFGQGDFAGCGLFLFTIRNGKPGAHHQGRGKNYAEKIMIVEESQITPMHFHWQKTEDIINRSGGQLVIQLYNSTQQEELDASSDVTVSVDSVQKVIPAGGFVRLSPGESITLVPGLYHKFWAEGGRVLVGEVSSVNDDQKDNRFHGEVGRFPHIQEDEPPIHLLVCDYHQYYPGKVG